MLLQTLLSFSQYLKQKASLLLDDVLILVFSVSILFLNIAEL